VGERLATALIRSQFPELAGAPLRAMAAGWDNAVFSVGTTGGTGGGPWVFRFPQRGVAIAGIEREIALLPEIAPALPLPVPVPRWVGRPDPRLGYPWPFFGSPLIVGSEVAELSLDDAARGALAEPLARFLRALHDPRLAARLSARLPVDPNRRADAPHRAAIAGRWLDDLAASGHWAVPQSVRRVLARATSLAPVPPTTVVHGDLHVRHVLLGSSGEPAGVIDWGDMGFADPSVDLALVWFLLPPAARRRFWDGYGPVSDAQLLRARILALGLSAALAVYARDEGLDALLREALGGLERTMADPGRG